MARAQKRGDGWEVEEGNRDQLAHPQRPCFSGEGYPHSLEAFPAEALGIHSRTAFIELRTQSLQGGYFVPISLMRTLRPREIKLLG